MKGIAQICIKAEESEKVFKALLPEMEDEIYKSQISLSWREGNINLEIQGDDLGSIRAALNTWISLVKIGIEMVKV
ncbi:MAG: hypothetical protein MUO26_10945 [Methanotrichaceae archaeon]|nr:hypothetical protein [Methanotrichaceae archaeon]